jgi:peptidyl-prolyl cis-trans isomerase D
VLQSMRSAAKYIWIILVVAFIGGFLLAETSGLMGRGPVTNTSEIASVNGEDILVNNYYAAVQNREQQESQRLGRAITLDERARVEQLVFDEMVTTALLNQELERRGIRVTDEEIRNAALNSPPPELAQNPELMTEGRFDREKYRRFLANPAARQGGLLQYLEQYYRAEIPRQKLFAQIASDVYVPDGRLWSMWQDQHDSAKVSYVVYRPDLVSDSGVTVSDAEVQTYYDRNKKQFERPGRAVLSLVTIPRAVTAADTAAARARAEALRAEVAGGAKFEDVAKRESSDSVSGANGGDLGRGGRNRFVPEFEQAAYALQPGQMSTPVLTQFGYHIIRVDEKKGDTLALRHILVKIGQSDSSAARTDRIADSVATLAASQEDPKKFDQAAAKFGLRVEHVGAIEGEPLTTAGRYVPSVSAWAFGGATPGETSDLFDAPDAYYLARLDSLVQGGPQSLAEVREEIRGRLSRDKKMQQLLPRAQSLSAAAQSGSLEAAARTAGVTVDTTPAFTRGMLVSGLGQFNEAVGAAFGLPQGKVSQPIVTQQGVYVIRVDRRVQADKGSWQAQKSAQRDQITGMLREQRVRDYIAGLRESAKIVDKRKDVQAAVRRQSDV